MEVQSYKNSSLYTLRHSTAHLLAQAFTELFPGVKLSIGPVIENGFYYDVELDTKISEEDFPRIEQRMKELAELNQPIRKLIANNREEAKKIILEDCSLGQGKDTCKYKLELLDAIPEGEEISFYEQKGLDKKGEEHRFIDLCRGPHVNYTKKIKAFKLMSIAGAYWRGDSNNIQLTRIYGTAFETKEDLENYLNQLEEAKKRDHRILGKELGLFLFSSKVGVGLPIWLPKGTLLRETLIQYMREQQASKGYQGVVTPHIALLKLFEQSGHTVNYSDKLFPLMENEDKETYLLKPVNCPFHCEIYASQLRSYRELPLRFSEFGTVYRYEQSGEVMGTLRVRGLTQDDAHLFVRPDQLQEEFLGVVKLIQSALDKLGLKDFRTRVGIKDPKSDKYIGSEENWDLSQKAIENACQSIGLPYTVSEGDAAFYGPKLDLVVRDAIGREWQMGTIQVDYNLPERFDLEYIGEDGQKHRPIMIHRTPFGSLERMIGLLIEHYGGAFPLWLAPVQVAVLPIADRHSEYAHQIAEILDQHKVRVHIDSRRETLGKKIREQQIQKVPYMIIIGDKDIENRTLGIRSREEGDIGAMNMEEFLARFQNEI